jgi:hypothetical protein
MVHKGDDVPTQFALKIIRNENILHRGKMISFLELDHLNVLKYYDFGELRQIGSPSSTGILMELCSGREKSVLKIPNFD